MKVFCFTLLFSLFSAFSALAGGSDGTLPPPPPGLEEFSLPDEAPPELLDFHSILPDSPPLPLESFSIEASDCEPAPANKTHSDAYKKFEAAIKDFKARRFTAAADNAVGLISLFPEKPWEGRAAFLAARAMGELKDYDACASLFDAARGHLPVLGDYSLYLLAGYYSGGGKKQEAADTYKKLVSSYPDSIIAKDALLNCSEALLDLGQHPEAIKTLKSLLGNDPGPKIAPKARLLFIAACIDTGELKTASSQYRVLRLEYPWADETAKAEDLIRKAGITPPEMTAGELLRIGDLMSGRGLNTQAVEVYREALRKSGDSYAARAKALLRLGKVYFKLRENSNAENALLEALTLATPSEDAAEIYLALARVYLRTGAKGEFRDAALWCASLYPGECKATDALYMLGVIFSQDGQYDEAVAIFDWILADCPTTRRADEVLWQDGWARFMKGDYESANAAFEALASRFPESTLAPQALYWRTKTLETLGLHEQAWETGNELTRSYGWSFYGLLTDEPEIMAFSSKSELGPIPASMDVPVRGSYRDERLTRAYELGLQGMRTSASRELKKVEKLYSRDLERLKEIIGLYIFIGEVRRPFDIATDLYRTSLETGSTQLSEEALRLLFPLGYWETVVEGSSRFGVDPLLVSGIIRQESSFNEGAVSPAGASGLMQLMPDTAKMVCRKLSIKFDKPRQLLDCDFNIPVGACYLQSLIQKHDGRLVYALAEYNAGPKNLNRWIAKMPEVSDDVFIEGIDFKETRGYVKKVLRNYMAYRKLYSVKKPETTASASAR